MYILIMALLLLAFFAASAIGLLSVLQEMVERYCQCEPEFREPGPILQDQGWKSAR